MENEGLTINEDWIFFNHEFYEEIGYQNTKKLLQSDRWPQCIFCSSDLVAFGVYQALMEEGISIPEQISLISIDNNRFDNLIGLSSVDLHNKEMGRKAGAIMLDLLNQREVPEREIYLEPHFIVRTSCKRKK